MKDYANPYESNSPFPAQMPLYIDMFTFEEEIDVEELKKAHAADSAVQDRYGIKYHQFWVNKESRMVFCLAEGPDEKTLEKAHKTVHGNLACNIVEVEPGFLKLLMCDGQPIDQGLVLNDTGSVDPAYRHLMNVDIALSNLAMPDHPSTVLDDVRNLVLERIVRFNGRVVEKLEGDAVVGVFDISVNAVRCAKAIQEDFTNLIGKDPELSIRMGLCTGFPLTQNGKFFGEALRLARTLCTAASPMTAIVSREMSEVCQLENVSPLRTLSKGEETFLIELSGQIENNLSDQKFNVNHLSRTLGVSRPQVFRKTVHITGRSPKDFIFAIRMNRALSLMKTKFGNVSEIALEVGYNSPSYFAKCFQRSFGCTPSNFMRAKPELVR